MNISWVPLLLLLLLGCRDAVVGDEGVDFLDLCEAQVEKIAELAISNYNAQCDLLATCNNDKNCSHGICEPLVGDIGGTECRPVIDSTYCPAIGGSNSPCTSRNLDYRQGYVRLARSTSRNSLNTMLSICSHRQLDPLLKTWANQTILTRSYFGTLDGSWRVLPASARSKEDCDTYDHRSRLWSRTATSVMKVVVVLIDLASSMNGNLPPANGVGTKLQAAKNIVRHLMPTLNGGDHINLIVFNSTGAYQLSPNSILVKEHDNIQTELQPLLDELEGLDVESQYKQSNITAAILAALPNFDSNPLAAKTILVLTDAVFTTFGNVTIPPAAGAKVFLYKLPQSNDADVILAINSSSLIKQLCTLGGHYEAIVRDLENPLLALNKYFSYFANLKRIETNGMPQYSDIYPNYERLAGNVTTVTKLAFSADGDLIGVAGVSIYMELLGDKTNPVKDALGSRVTGYSYPTKPILLTSANCTSFLNGTAQACAGGYVKNGGLCEQTDTKSTIQDLACCEICQGGSDKPSNTRKIVGSVVGTIFGAVLLVLFVVCILRTSRFRNIPCLGNRTVNEPGPQPPIVQQPIAEPPIGRIAEH